MKKKKGAHNVETGDEQYSRTAHGLWVFLLRQHGMNEGVEGGYCEGKRRGYTGSVYD